ncbi:MAG: phenylalanine--tRNA ligase subunit alpha [Chlamydiota bacterium]|nr:phenylalanine--tRNA ligase subunit alpha [Chlamydiota bacterium]
MSVLDQIAKISEQFKTDLENVKNTTDLDSLKVKYLGRKGPVQGLMKELRNATSEERPQFGKSINDLKTDLEKSIEKFASLLIQKEEDDKLISEEIDVTLPGRRRYPGREHVITQALDEIIDILVGMGFSVEYGPDIDSDYYNFEALNFAPDHPARDMQDTFYISEDHLLRTHTSNVQVRVMEKNKPPIRVIAPGKAYRNENISARSHVFFQQVEGFYIDKNVTFSDLISTLDEFIKKLFKSDIPTRFRPSYFPFVEPGMEVDIWCLKCEGKGCPICKHTGWLEVCGAGMIHPEVLKNGGIDPEEYTGYAWGMGVERLLLLKYGIDDIRRFTENDLRFLRQFPAA